ncbi:MAG TPA: hypothetical protein VHA11_14185 [Bryobacteraceae bacterium]|nr:hypothetical protein [Bryobacteraceae bacterium]
MPSTRLPSDTIDPISNDDANKQKWELVQRVAASSPFQRTARLREFLLYVCERSLRNQLDEIREANIGNNVFGRGADYNPSEDNIVRVEARHLRKRLASYFAEEGKDEPIVITIPKGSYAPLFLPREDAERGVDQTVLPPVPEPAPEAPAAPAVHRRPAGRLALVLGVSAALLAALCLWLLLHNLSLRGQLAERDDASDRLPWSAVFDGGHQTKIVLADSCLVLYEDVAHQQVSLADYVSRGYLKHLQDYSGTPELRSLLEIILSRQYTSLADVSLVGKIMQFSQVHRDDVVLSYARNVNIRDFKSNHVILVGALRANPWVELFEPRMNFRFGYDEKLRRPYFRNRSPRAGEQRVYFTGGPDGTSAESYAVVALLPNLNRAGNVLLIEGTNSEGTEGGVEYLTDRDFVSRVLPRLGWKSGGRVPYFEILLRLRAVGGTSKDTEAIAYRVIE